MFRKLAAASLSVALVSLALAAPAAARPNLSGGEFNGLKKDIKKALKMGQYSMAAGKIRDMGKDDSDRALDFLCSLAKIPDAETYNAAMEAVASMKSAEVEEEILKLMEKSGKAVEKMLLVDAMAERNDPFAGKALGKAVTSKQAEVQRAAISAIKRKKMKHAVDGLIELLEVLEKKDKEGLNYSLVQETLTAITGESFEVAADWKNYWEPRKQSFRPITGAAKKAPGGTMRRKRPRFFGSELKSNRLVFVIDTSGSMTAADPQTGGTRNPTGSPRGPQTGGGPAQPKPAQSNSRVRIERAKFQLLQAIDALPAKARFTILAYSGVLVQGPSGQPQLPPGADPNLLPPKMGGFEWLKIWKPKLMPANARSKEDAKKFVKGLQANGGTFTMNALMHAFKVVGADTVILLSDGFPNDFDVKANKQLNGDEILDKVKAMNRMRRMVIDTFGFDAAGPPAGGGGFGGGRRAGGGTGAGPGGGGLGPMGGAGGGLSGFMKKLANQNGGSYTQIR